MDISYFLVYSLVNWQSRVVAGTSDLGAVLWYMIVLFFLMKCNKKTIDSRRS